MRARFAAFVLLAGTLAACTSSSSHPRTTPTPTPTPTPTSTPSSAVSTSPPNTKPRTTPRPRSSAPRTGPLTTGPGVKPGDKPPVLPAYARKNDATGAADFASYYFQAFSWGYETNDPTLVEQISGPHCAACQHYISSLSAVVRQGGVLHGGQVTIRSTAPFLGTTHLNADYVIDVAIDEDPIVVTLPGQPRDRVEGRIRDFHLLVYVSWLGDKWRVVEVSKK